MTDDRWPTTAMNARTRRATRPLSTAVCALLLVAWAAWLGVSYQRDHLQGCEHTLVTIPAFGGDFYYYIDVCARIWFAGEDPYSKEVFLGALPPNTRLSPDFATYPPFAWRLFAWVNLFTPKTALGVWWAALTVILAAAAWKAAAVRGRLGVSAIPPLVAIVATLFSSPALFCYERGQYDPVALLAILAAVQLLRMPQAWAECCAGAILVLAPWAKVYPALLAVGLVGLRRWKALAAFAAVGCMLLAADDGEFRRFLANTAEHVRAAENLAAFCGGKPCPWNHSLYLTWPSLWVDKPMPFAWLARIPGKAAAAALLGPLLALVTWSAMRCPRRDDVAYPLLLWTVALATFVPPVSNDYNLCFLPLAVLALWDRRDPWPIHVALALLAVWWQPVNLGISGRTMFCCKLVGLYAAGGLIVLRARMLVPAGAAPGETHDADEAPIGAVQRRPVPWLSAARGWC